MRCLKGTPMQHVQYASFEVHLNVLAMQAALMQNEWRALYIHMLVFFSLTLIVHLTAHKKFT